ncbi:MAG: ABC transporter ATP-binding protein [Planctomycetota bacterium]
MIEVQDFTKLYGQHLAVDRLSFRVHPGEILGLVGPNGAGKTTTLRGLAGILAPTSGTIRIGGVDIAEDPLAAKASLAYVPDNPSLFESLTVEEHLKFMATLYRVPEAVAEIPGLLADFDLGDKRHALASELSRGMRQKLAICCAHLHRPRVILLDEPLNGLDPRGIRQMRSWIASRAAAQVTLVVSSHQLDLVERLCHRVLALQHGHVVLMGSLDEIRARFPELNASATLEEIFFHAIEHSGDVPWPSEREP